MAIGALITLALALVVVGGAAAGRLTFSGGPAPGCDQCPVPGLIVTVHGSGARGRVHAVLRTGPGGRFRLRLAAGYYQASSNDGMGCSGTLVVLPFRTASTSLDCGGP
ncbi:MAG: hypothetical protein ACRDJU_02535 [Actinomycetota bacterium]